MTETAAIDLLFQIPFVRAEKQLGPVAWSCDTKWISARTMLEPARFHSVVWAVDTEAGVSALAFVVGGTGSEVTIAEWSPTDPEAFLAVFDDRLAFCRVSTDGRSFTEVWSNRGAGMGGILRASFAPTGDAVAAATEQGKIVLINVADGLPYNYISTDIAVNYLYWSPTGLWILAIGSSDDGSENDSHVLLVRADGLLSRRVQGTSQEINWAAWSADGKYFCTADTDRLVRVRNQFGDLLTTLEGHTSDVMSVSFSSDDRLLFSQDRAGGVLCWQTGSWRRYETGLNSDSANLSYLVAAPMGSLLANLDEGDDVLEIYRFDVDRLAATFADAEARTYANAKVVLIGDTGVGKSGLSLVLTGQPYAATDSTHARKVWTLDESNVDLPDGGVERREILLWDMAGQPGYRLIHQLHLSEVAVAVVVFDARSEIDPFAGVRYWARALRQRAGHDIPAILVAARSDRGGVPVSRQRIEALCEELGLAAFFETSAREGHHVGELSDAIRAAIDWSTLPQTVSTELFETLKQFLLAERDSDRILATGDDLYRLFLREFPERAAVPDLRASFDTCVRLLELRDLVRRLSFGGFVLLRPELLDAYASALIDAARAQPDGLGFLPEAKALTGDFPIPSDVRLPAAEEKLLLISMVEELLRHDVALRVSTDDGVDLVFPSQLTVDKPEEPDASVADVVFRFDGAVQSVYATLAVRLAHVAAYQRDQMWRNACTYRVVVGGVCGLRVREVEEGRGELTVFFAGDASEETRFLFEEYCQAHLTARTLSGSVVRERVFTCPACDYRLPADLIRRRQARGSTDMQCPVCDEVRISLLDRQERLSSVAQVRDMNASADAGRDRAAATATIRGKEETGDYDVFLSYNSQDRAEIVGIADRLRTEGILPWVDQLALAAGIDWHDELETQIAKVRAGAVFVGPHGLGQWQKREAQALISESAQRSLRLIPVFLPGAAADATLPMFLGQSQAVDFRTATADPFARLVKAINGDRSIR